MSERVGACVGRYRMKDVLFGLRHGFAADRVYLYGREEILSGLYLSDLQRQFTRFINPKPVREFLEDKLLFEAIVNTIVRVPKNYIYCDSGHVVVLSDVWHKIACPDAGHKSHRLVMKRSRGGGGVEIDFFEVKNGIVSINGKNLKMQEFYQMLQQRDERIVCEFVEQSQFFSRIYPHTTNSLRLICMRDSASEPFITKAVLRLGTQKSKGVDNFGRGGLAAAINIETGILGEAIEHDMTSPRAPVAHEFHPDTGIRIKGEALPGWSNARDETLLLMRKLRFINYVGWDIVMTERGPVFLEGNNYTGVRLAQAQAGLLQDIRAYGFYRRFGII